MYYSTPATKIGEISGICPDTRTLAKTHIMGWMDTQDGDPIPVERLVFWRLGALTHSAATGDVYPDLVPAITSLGMPFVSRSTTREGRLELRRYIEDYTQKGMIRVDHVIGDYEDHFRSDVVAKAKYANKLKDQKVLKKLVEDPEIGYGILQLSDLEKKSRLFRVAPGSNLHRFAVKEPEVYKPIVEEANKQYKEWFELLKKFSVSLTPKETTKDE